MYSNDSHSASHLGNTDPCMDDFDIDSYVHINCAWNQNVKAYNILNEVRASQLAWAWVVSPIYIGRLLPSQYLSKVQLCCLNLVQGELPNLEYISVLQLFSNAQHVCPRIVWQAMCNKMTCAKTFQLPTFCLKMHFWWLCTSTVRT